MERMFVYYTVSTFYYNAENRQGHQGCSNYNNNVQMRSVYVGYGGFNVSVQPTFSVTRLVFMQHFDGVVAIPNIRGGG